MEVDAHLCQSHPSEDFGALGDPFNKACEFWHGDGRGFHQGDGCLQRPILHSDIIHFNNIDGFRSLMTAWKKLVSTSPSHHHKPDDFLSHHCTRRNLYEQEVDFNEDLGQIHNSFVDGEDNFWDDAFFDCAPP